MYFNYVKLEKWIFAHMKYLIKCKSPTNCCTLCAKPLNFDSQPGIKIPGKNLEMLRSSWHL